MILYRDEMHQYELKNLEKQISIHFNHIDKLREQEEKKGGM